MMAAGGVPCTAQLSTWLRQLLVLHIELLLGCSGCILCQAVLGDSLACFAREPNVAD